jgi:hypothetical protein
MVDMEKRIAVRQNVQEILINFVEEDIQIKFTKFKVKKKRRNYKIIFLFNSHLEYNFFSLR